MVILQWADDLQFKGDRYLTEAMLAEAAELGEFSPIRPLERRPGGELHCSLKIRLKTETNYGSGFHPA